MKKNKDINKKIYINTSWTCVRRRFDAVKCAKYFSINNHEIIDNPKKADIILIFTCAFSNFRADKCIERINNFKKYKSEIIIAGCLPAIEPKRIKELSECRILITKNLDKIDIFFPNHKYKWKDIEDANILWENKNLTKPIDLIRLLINKSNLIKNFNNKFVNILNYSSFSQSTFMLWHRITNERPFYIRVSWGCMGKCTYCAIRNAIGKMRSKSIDVCISELRNGLKKGYKNFILEADDIGSYGLDINSNFPELLKNLSNINGDYSIDVNYIHPRWIVKYIDELEKILRIGKVRRISSSIQSANPRILRLMNRYPEIDKISNAFIRLKKARPNIFLETEIICGFPSETFKEFNDTLRFFKKVDFNWLVIFPYSRKKGTRAEEIEPKITNKEISKNINFAFKYLKKYGYNVNYAKSLKKFNQLIGRPFDIYPISKNL